MAALAKPAVKPPSQVPAETSSAQRTLSLVGFWSAVLTAIFYVGWLLGMAASFVLTKPWSDYAPMAPPLFIPLAWIPLILTIRRWAAEDRKIFGDIAAAFAVMCGALLTMNYFVALTVTIPKQSAGVDVGLLAIQLQGFFLAVEAIGYTLMSLSAHRGFALSVDTGFVFGGTRLQGWIRWMLLITGVFAIVLPFQML